MNEALYTPPPRGAVGVHALCPEPGSLASLVTASCFECLLTLPAFLLQGFLLSCWRSVKPGKAGDNTPLANEGQEPPIFLKLCTEVSAAVRPLTLEWVPKSPGDLIKMQILVWRSEVGQDSAFLICPQVMLVLMAHGLYPQ